MWTIAPLLVEVFLRSAGLSSQNSAVQSLNWSEISSCRSKRFSIEKKSTRSVFEHSTHWFHTQSCQITLFLLLCRRRAAIQFSVHPDRQTRQPCGWKKHDKKRGQIKVILFGQRIDLFLAPLIIQTPFRFRVHARFNFVSSIRRPSRREAHR